MSSCWPGSISARVAALEQLGGAVAEDQPVRVHAVALGQLAAAAPSRVRCG